MINDRRSTRRPVRHLAAMVVLAVVVATGATACEPRQPAKDRPVLLVHGWAAGGATDCGSTFDGLIASLRSQGFTGPMIKVGFYTGDTNCTVSLRDHGSFSNGSSWKEVAKAFSHHVHQRYTSRDQTVDVVGYSMGGNIARGAVYGSAKREAGFAPPIKVEDAVTLGTPHTGAAWFTNFCLWGQCATLKPGHSDLRWLAGDGNPQGVGGTEWTVVGSDGDAVVPVESALAMSVPAERKVRYANVPHTGSGNYMGDPTARARIGRALAEAGV